MKMYTIDGALLCEQPEIRIGEKVYPVDDRKSTFEKVMAITKNMQSDGSNGVESIDSALEIAFGKSAFSEISKLNMHYAAYQRVFETVMAIFTGETPEEVSARFQTAKKST